MRFSTLHISFIEIFSFVILRSEEQNSCLFLNQTSRRTISTLSFRWK